MLVIVFLHVFGFLENQYQTKPKQRKNFGLIFSGPEETLEGSGEGQKNQEGATSPRGAPLGLWAPRGTSNPNSTSINTQIFP